MRREGIVECHLLLRLYTTVVLAKGELQMEAIAQALYTYVLNVVAEVLVVTERGLREFHSEILFALVAESN